MHTLYNISDLQDKIIQTSSSGVLKRGSRKRKTTFASETLYSAKSKPDHRTWANQEALEYSCNPQRARHVSALWLAGKDCQRHCL